MNARRAEHRPWPRLAVSGVAMYLVFMVASAPASLAAWLLARWSAGAALLDRPQGTLWRGQAAGLVIAAPGSPRQRIDGVDWALSGSRLARAQFAVRVSAQGGAATGVSLVVLMRRSMRLLDLAVTSPAPVLAGWLPLLQLGGARGEIAVRSSDVLIGPNNVRGHAAIEWVDAATALSPVSPLGTYRAVIDGNGAAARFEVSTRAGALRIAGSGEWSVSQGLRFAGEAVAAPANAVALEPLLQLLGPADSRGVRPLKYSSPLR